MTPEELEEGYQAECAKLEYKVGDTVRYVGRDRYGSIEPGDILKVTEIQLGIFPFDLYVSVLRPDGEKAQAYSWRFKLENTNDS